MPAATAPNFGRFRLALAAARAKPKPVAGRDPRDGDGDGFRVGPDGKDDVPVGKPADDAGGHPLKRPGETGAAFLARVKAKATALGATPAQAEAVAAKAKSVGAGAAGPGSSGPYVPRHPGESDDAFVARVKTGLSGYGLKPESADRVARAALAHPLNQESPPDAAPPQPPSAAPLPPLPTPKAAPPTPLDRSSRTTAPPPDASPPRPPDPAGLESQVRQILPGVGDVRGVETPVPVGTGVGPEVDPADHARRVGRMVADLRRVVTDFPGVARGLQDGPPLARLAFAPHVGISAAAGGLGAYYGGLRVPLLRSLPVSEGPQAGLRLGDRTLTVASVPGAEGKLRLGGGAYAACDESGPSVLRHELGHHMEACHPDAFRAVKAIYNSRPKAQWANSVSQYGSGSARELFAESFAAYTHPDYGAAGSPRLPGDIHDLFERTFGPRRR